MAIAAAVPVQAHGESITRSQALRLAWVCWLMLLAIPALYFLVVLWQFIDDDSVPADPAMAQRWFLGCMAFLAIAVPASFFLRSREFKGYWTGHCVSPSHYLKGMLSVWLTMEIGGLLALTGCLVTQSLLPNLLPALVAFILFIPFWPSGRAMTTPCGADDDDPENYAEPR
jgi:hypothetical protein